MYALQDSEVEISIWVISILCYATVFISNNIFYHVHKLIPQDAAKLTGIFLYFIRKNNMLVIRHYLSEKFRVTMWVKIFVLERWHSFAVECLLYDRANSRHAIFVSKVARSSFSVDAYKFTCPHTHTHTPRRCVAVELTTLWRPQIWPWVPQVTYGISRRWLLPIPSGGSMWHRLVLRFRNTELFICEIQGFSSGIEI